MGINVVDDTKLQAALSGVTDEAAKQLATQVLPVAAALIDAAVTKLCTELETVTGATLADITAERQELVNDIHGILDRISATPLGGLLVGPRKSTN